MNRHNHPTPRTIPANKINRNAELDELHFSDGKSQRTFGEPDEPAVDRQDGGTANVKNLGLTEAALPGNGPTDDDLSPETLIHEDGARSPHEPGSNVPMDQQLTKVTEREIGAGYGLDEAELARIKPLDNKSWEENPTAESYSGAPPYDRRTKAHKNH